MTKKTVEVRTGLVLDPHVVPVTFANIFAGGGTVNNVINFTLCVNRFTPTYDGPVDPDAVVAARIRIDLNTAVAMKNFLQSQIELLTAPQEKAN